MTRRGGISGGGGDDGSCSGIMAAERLGWRESFPIWTNDTVPGAARENTMANSDSVLAHLGADAHALVRRAWWVFLVGGIAMVAFGALALVNPGVALFVLATFFAASVLVDGLSNVVGSIQNRDKDGWWIMLLIGLLGAGVGGYALFNPPLSILAFVLIVAIEAIVLGVFLVMLGYKVRKASNREWILYLAGAVSVAFGALVLVNPGLGSLSIVYVIASWSLMIGVFKIMFAFKAKGLSRRSGEKTALG
jgi:uncharacterized membrane protein HdeD (DUF308 family)